MSRGGSESKRTSKREYDQVLKKEGTKGKQPASRGKKTQTTDRPRPTAKRTPRFAFQTPRPPAFTPNAPVFEAEADDVEGARGLDAADACSKALAVWAKLMQRRAGGHVEKQYAPRGVADQQLVQVRGRVARARGRKALGQTVLEAGTHHRHGIGRLRGSRRPGDRGGGRQSLGAIQECGAFGSLPGALGAQRVPDAHPAVAPDAHHRGTEAQKRDHRPAVEAQGARAVQAAKLGDRAALLRGIRQITRRRKRSDRAVQLQRGREKQKAKTV